MNKTQIHEAVKKAAIPVNVGVAGRKRLIKLKASDRSVVADTGWTNNLITNAGLDDYCSYTSTLWADGYCEVGTGNTAPAVTDTSLVTSVAQTNSKITGASQNGRNLVDGYAYRLQGWEFSEGTFSGQNLAEVGFKILSGGDLGSRSLIVDGSGSPTTFPVQSDEVLQVYYEFRVYWPSSDVNTSVVDTTTSTNHTLVIRPAEVDSNAWSAQNALGSSFSQVCYTYNGTLGAVDESPSGQSGIQTTTETLNTYTNGDYSRTITYSFSLTEGNAVGGVSAIKFAFGQTNWQCSWDPVQPKDDTKKWDVSFEISVSRAVI